LAKVRLPHLSAPALHAAGSVKAGSRTKAGDPAMDLLGTIKVMSWRTRDRTLLTNLFLT
jgi:hypothetical protein